MSNQRKLLRWRVKLLKLGNFNYIHIPILILKNLSFKHGDWTTISEESDGSIKIEPDKEVEESDRVLQ